MEKSPDAFRTISEVADWLGVQAHVLRFWESKFSQIKPMKRAGGRRYYRPADMALLAGIRQLLHDDGMTIKGTQKILRERGVAYVSGLADPPEEITAAPIDTPLDTPFDPVPPPAPAKPAMDLSSPAPSAQPDLFAEATPDLPPQAPDTAPVPEGMPDTGPDAVPDMPPETDPAPVSTAPSDLPQCEPEPAPEPDVASPAPEVAPTPKPSEPDFAPGLLAQCLRITSIPPAIAPELRAVLADLRRFADGADASADGS